MIGRARLAPARAPPTRPPLARTSGGPGADAGLRSGDVVTKLGDANVQNANDLVAAIASHRPGDKVAVTVERSSKPVQLTVTLGTQPAQSGTGG